LPEDLNNARIIPQQATLIGRLGPLVERAIAVQQRGQR
jgi:hypothetical protein